jgi:hypothetical protein
MQITTAIAGRRRSGAKDVSMGTFFLQDPNCDLEIHHKRWFERPPVAISFRVAFDKALLSDRLLHRAKVEHADWPRAEYDQLYCVVFRKVKP